MRRFLLAVDRRLAVLLLLAAIAPGCSDNSTETVCRNCEAWTQLVTDLGRQASTHPTDPNFVVYGTIHKIAGAPDESRESDEDLWLLWRNGSDRSQWVRWQLTADEMGEGDNFQARWSPLGDRVVFVHSNAAGKYEIWTMPITLPPGNPPSAAFDPSGQATLVTINGRDPAWLDNDSILFSRKDKIYLIDGVARGGSNETQITFDPPSFVSSSNYIDRNPYVSSDGVMIFSTVGREEVADVLLAAFEILPGSPPETTATEAFIGMQAPGAPRIVYPVAEGVDTLVTSGNDADPYVIVHSLPSNEVDYVFGARRDARFLPKGEEFYCDTLLTQAATLSPGEIDTVRFYFEPARGSLTIASGRPFTSVHWERVDHRVVSFDDLLEGECSWTTFDCVFSYQVTPSGQILPGVLEPLRVIGRTNTGELDTVMTQVAPGTTAIAKVFCDADTCGCVPPGADANVTASWNTGPRTAKRSAWNGQRMAGAGGGGGVRAAVGEFSVWRADLTNPARPTFIPIVGSDASLQSPILSPAFAGGVRYLAYASNPDGIWGIYIQKLDAASFQLIGDRIRVETPGTTDNFICDRNTFHPSWVTGSSPGSLRLLVTMTDCPDNGFEDSGFDDDPWNQGELNVWEVAVPF